MSVFFRNVRVFGGQKDENDRSKFVSLIGKRATKFFTAKMIDVNMHNIYWSDRSSMLCGLSCISFFLIWIPNMAFSHCNLSVTNISCVTNNSCVTKISCFSVLLLPDLECICWPNIVGSIFDQFEHDRVEFPFFNRNLEWFCLLFVLSLQSISLISQSST